MKTIEIGRSGIRVPALGMGTWAIGGGAWWGDQDDRISISAIQRAVDLGIVWIDTAPIYGLFHSEEIVGRALEGRRDKVVLSTKCGLEWRHATPVFHKTVDGTDVYRDLSKASMIQDVEESLKRLKTDHLDVLYTHWQTTDTALYPVEETLDAFLTLKAQGKIRAIGASNVTPDFVRAYLAAGGFGASFDHRRELCRHPVILPFVHRQKIKSHVSSAFDPFIPYCTVPSPGIGLFRSFFKRSSFTALYTFMIGGPPAHL